MKVIHLASAKAAWRGYEYYKDNKVLSYEKTAAGVYCGKVRGSGSAIYDAVVNIDHPRSSKCNCPHAIGTSKICKHITALYFAIFPDDAATYKKTSHDPFIPSSYHYDDFDDCEYGDLRNDLPHEIELYINNASKTQLQNHLTSLLRQIDDELFDRFTDECGIEFDNNDDT